MSAKFGTLGPTPKTFTHPAGMMGGSDQRSFRRGALRSEKSKEQMFRALKFSPISAVQIRKGSRIIRVIVADIFARSSPSKLHRERGGGEKRNKEISASF
jgi:hypothetical protein